MQSSNNTNVAIYARFSSYNQKEESIEQQVEECAEFARKNNLHVVAVYADRHLTGRSDRRPDFQRMIRDAEKGQFGAILAYKSNRIARNMLHALNYENKLSDFGVRVLYVKEEFGNTPAGRFALRNMMNLNQFYSENLGEDVLRAMMDNAKKCKSNGSLPYGYASDLDGKIIINKKQAEAVRYIFENVANGVPFRDISEALNAAGHRTKSGLPFGKSSYSTIVFNERYKGIYIFKGVKTDGGMPRIISDELYERVQIMLGNKRNPCGRRTNSDGRYSLTGILFCGHCKSPMIGVSGTSRSGEKHHYYACKSKLKKECDKSNVRRDWIEKIVLDAVRTQVLTDTIISEIADGIIENGRRLRRESPAESLKKELEGTKKAIQNLLKAIENGIFTSTTKERLVELEEKQQQLERRIKEEERKIPTVTREQIIFWLTSFKHGNFESESFRAKLFKTFLFRVYLYDDRLELHFDGTGEAQRLDVPIAEPPADVLTGSAQGSQKTLTVMVGVFLLTFHLRLPCYFGRTKA